MDQRPAMEQLEGSASGKWILSASVVCAAGLVAIVVANMDGGLRPIPGPPRAESRATLPSSSREVDVLSVEETSVPRESLEGSPGELVERADSSPAGAASSGALGLERMQAALEDSLHGHIDPNIFLEAALALTDLEVGGEALEPGPIPGVTRYPILGTPDGVRAELWIGDPPESVYGSARSYVIDCELPEEHYIAEGAVRGGMRAQVTIWTDLDGKVKNFGVVTDMEISGMSVRMGMPLDDVPTGLLYSYDPAEPFDVVGYQAGISSGRPTSWKHRPLVISGRTPPDESLDLLSAGLLSAHASGN